MSYVAMTRCYFCGEGSDILLHTRFRDIDQYHDKIINMKPCQKCQEQMKTHILLIGVIEEDLEKENLKYKNDPQYIPDPYRTGNIIWVIRQLINHEQAQKLGWAFCGNEIINQLKEKYVRDTLH